jgi:hypothetical protein
MVHRRKMSSLCFGRQDGTAANGCEEFEIAVYSSCGDVFQNRSKHVVFMTKF